MQRLFSIFPTGLVGVTLLVLRIFMAATVIINVLPQSSAWGVVAVILATLLLCLGLLTPCVSSVLSIANLGLLVTTTEPRFQLVTAVILGASVSVLGPGAYSLDSRIFGRKLLEIPPKSAPHS